ncbi:MAG: hypothetical protein ACTSW2_07550 [Alphaproteobacteria bacterium]
MPPSSSAHSHLGDVRVDIDRRASYVAAFAFGLLWGAVRLTAMGGRCTAFTSQ